MKSSRFNILTKDELIGCIAATALLKGDFTLSSGRQSDYYIDKYKFSSDPVLLNSIGKWLGQSVIRCSPDKVAGAELGGIPLVTAVSLQTGLPAIYVRKKKKGHGNRKQIDGDFEADDKIVLVEDVCTTGGQIVEAALQLKYQGGKVIKVVSVVDREEGARKSIESAGFEYESLFTAKDILAC